MTDFNLANWFIYALTGSTETVIDWRCIHDTDKGLPAHNYRGTLREMWVTLERYNSNGYGIFCTVNQMDGQGRELANVQAIRAHVIDLDNLDTSQANYERAAASGASFAVQSSPGKYHVYWKVQPYAGNDFYTTQQRKLVQLYESDRKIIDPTRVMRVPGFLHLKNQPFLVTGWNLQIEKVRTWQELETELSHVNVFDHVGGRSPLGTPEMSAPSLEWLRFAISLVDPNELDRSEWLSLSAAIKQAGWNHTDPETLYNLWADWCAQYEHNDAPENLKLWNSIRDTETGWKTISNRTTVRAYMDFGFKDAPPQTGTPNTTPPPPTTNQNTDDYGEILSPEDCKHYFKDCYFVSAVGKIFKNGRFMNATEFNGSMGGKNFIITSTGKLTDEPWKAALRSTCWTIPVVDHVRFLPDNPTFDIVEDELGRAGLNTYMPAHIKAVEGDISLFLNHLNLILPDPNDRKIICDYLAHCVKFPGYKIPWSPLLQSAEGIGKTIFVELMAHALGSMYIYSPKANELVASGSVFNAWQRRRLMIMVNEIKIDERRELIEILKPMITDNRIEIQGKGENQEMEDNPANWFFFSNFDDAIPINKNGRRYAIFYSALQNAADIANAGMDDEYFNRLWSWLRSGGYAAITHWLLNYPIERGQIPVRAPKTSSYELALQISRSPLETIIIDSIEDQINGFKGGYVSSIQVINRAKAAGLRNTNARTVQACMKGLGYVHLGRAIRPYFAEDATNRSDIYGNASNLSLEGYGRAQGYE